MVEGMSHITFCTGRVVGLLLLALLSLGCDGEPRTHSDGPSKEGNSQAATKGTGQTATAGATAKAVDPFAGAKRSPLGKNLWLETKGNHRRVVVGTTVCLREGGYGLECLLCRKHTKEHESILSTDADASEVHAALMVAGGEPGSPVQYKEKDGKVTIIPPSGSRIKVLVQYEQKGKTVTVPAQEWVRNAMTKKDLQEQWVFAGSYLADNPDGKAKKPIYGANVDGTYIAIYNMPSALLDLPINSPNKAPEAREFQPYTERIPELETKVFLLLEPQGEAKKPAK
jgi:hypothetical protein